MNAFENKKKLNIIKHLVIAGVVVFCIALCAIVFCFNITPTVALEQEHRCGMIEHVHTNECYEGDFLVCTQRAHSHNGNCYLVLLKQNDINNILTMLDESKERSLETFISDIMDNALTEEETGETVDRNSLTPTVLEKLNEAIAANNDLPNLILNENINTLATESALDINKDPVTNDLYANFYIYLDGAWVCIGSLEFNTERSSNRYNSVIDTADLLDFINSALSTEYNYNSFDIAVSSSQNGTYSKTNISISQTKTVIGYRQQSNTAEDVKYVRLIPNNGAANSTAFSFSTVRYVYPNGSTAVRYVRTGTTVTLPSGNYVWRDVNNTYASGEAVTINGPTSFYAAVPGPLSYVMINYDISFPTVNGVTVATRPTIAGLSSTRVTDEFAVNSSAVIRNVSSQAVQGSVDGNTTGLSRMIYFKGWQIENTDIIVQPNTTLVWDELVQYASGNTINLKAVWEYDALQTATFFIRFDSVAVDTNGNITEQDSNLYTKELFAAYVGGIDLSLNSSQLNSLYNIADTTADNSFGADQKIRALYGEKTDGIWLSAFPTDDYIFESLKQYAETGYLSVDGDPVKVEDLNKNAYAIRWYVLKSQSDAWHIDGKLVKKEGLIHVYKTFSGNKALIAEAKNGFYINALDVNDGRTRRFNLTNYVSYDHATETYMWEIDSVVYNEQWRITEYSGLADNSFDYSIYSEYTVMDAHEDQSTTGVGTTVTVRGITYALDEGIDTVLRVEFNNIYNRSDSIIIKKQDALTGVSIGGATFQLLQNGKALCFTYNSVTDSYIYNPNGTYTLLNGTENGYFEISIEGISYDLGSITICEITPPAGYSPIGNIEIGNTDANKTIGILSGNSELVKYVDGVLIVGNSTDSSSVTVKKNWECPENEWQDVTIELLANGKPVAALIAGVIPQVILNSDNNWTYTWENLPVYINGVKIEWSVRETQIGSEQSKSDNTFVNWLVSYELPIYSTDSDGNENILLTVTNTTKRVMLRLTKTDIRQSVQLKGATFLLEVVDQNGNVVSSEVVKTATTDDTGTLIFDNMKCNVGYRLTETAAPDGYVPINEYIYFVIKEDGSVEVEESYYAQAGSTAYNITVRNSEALALPGSGGAGDMMYYAIGAFMILASLGICIYTSHKKRRCNN